MRSTGAGFHRRKGDLSALVHGLRQWQVWSGLVRSHGTADSQTVALEYRSDHERHLSFRQTAAVVVSAAIVLVVIAGYFRYVARYATNGVFWDEWNWVELMRRSSGGSLTLSDLWAQHNENRMLYHNLIAIILGNITGVSDIAFMYLGAILLVAGVLLLIVGCRGDLLKYPLAYVPAIFLFFSLAQYENTLWAFQFAWFLIVACICGVLVLLTPPRLRLWRLFVSIALGIVASYSSLAGLTIWPAGLVALLRPAIPTRLRIAWFAAGGLVTAFYLYGLKFASIGGPPLSGFLDRLPTALSGFLVAVGSVVPGVRLVTRNGTDFSVTMVFGALISAAALTVMASWTVHGRNDRVLTIAAGLIVVGLSFDLLLMPTRVSAAISNGTASRYTTFNVLLLAGVFMGAIRTMIIAIWTGVLAGGVVRSPLPVPPEFGDIRSDATQWRAWLALSSVYEQRSDLQTAFPGPTSNASRRMVAWAVRSGQNPNDPIYAPVLIPYSTQYMIWLGEER